MCNSSSSVLVLNRTSPSLLHTSVAYTTQLPFSSNIPVILSETHTSRVSAFGRLLVFLTFPYPVPVPKKCVIFLGCNFKSRASQVGLHNEKKDTASAKKGNVSFQRR